jgi:hypothetical protein
MSYAARGHSLLGIDVKANATLSPTLGTPREAAAWEATV